MPETTYSIDGGPNKMGDTYQNRSVSIASEGTLPKTTNPFTVLAARTRVGKSALKDAAEFASMHIFEIDVPWGSTINRAKIDFLVHTANNNTMQWRFGFLMPDGYWDRDPAPEIGKAGSLSQGSPGFVSVPSPNFQIWDQDGVKQADPWVITLAQTWQPYMDPIVGNAKYGGIMQITSDCEISHVIASVSGPIPPDVVDVNTRIWCEIWSKDPGTDEDPIEIIARSDYYTWDEIVASGGRFDFTSDDIISLDASQEVWCFIATNAPNQQEIRIVTRAAVQPGLHAKTWWRPRWQAGGGQSIYRASRLSRALYTQDSDYPHATNINTNVINPGVVVQDFMTGPDTMPTFTWTPLNSSVTFGTASYSPTVEVDDLHTAVQNLVNEPWYEHPQRICLVCEPFSPLNEIFMQAHTENGAFRGVELTIDYTVNDLHSCAKGVGSMQPAVSAKAQGRARVAQLLTPRTAVQANRKMEPAVASRPRTRPAVAARASCCAAEAVEARGVLRLAVSSGSGLQGAVSGLPVARRAVSADTVAAPAVSARAKLRPAVGMKVTLC